MLRIVGLVAATAVMSAGGLSVASAAVAPEANGLVDRPAANGLVVTPDANGLVDSPSANGLTDGPEANGLSAFAFYGGPTYTQVVQFATV